MNENRKEELLTRWMDDSLSEEELRELEPVLAESPELKDEREEYHKVRGALRAVIPAEVDPPYPEFFNTHLERLVQDATRSERAARKTKGTGPGRLWVLWLAPAAAAAVVAAFILGLNSAPQQPPPVLGASEDGSAVYSPLASVSADIVHDKALGATLIVVEGLDTLSDEDLVIGDGSLESERGFFVTSDEIY